MNIEQLTKLLPYVELDRDTSARYEGMSGEDVVADLIANGVDPMEFAMAQAKARMAVNGCIVDLEHEFTEHPMQAFKRAQEEAKLRPNQTMKLLEALFQPPTAEELEELEREDAARRSPEGQQEPPEEDQP